jgi:PTH1 family peptidyl-tRNA hydrolase|tara:strand:+ start:1662 stop:2312 length:651 start_codon:yes stop_codon:yes gene_type:complete
LVLKRFLDPFRLLRSEERKRLEDANSRKPLIVIGLANPGAKYRGTRHNVGAMCVDELARRAGARLENKVRDTELAETEIGGAPAIIVRPITFVNESGKSVRNVLRKFNAEPDRLLLIVDDMDLKIGRLRLRVGGSSGGHNGLKSVRQVTGTDEFPRMRIGVGRPPAGSDPIQHVLGRFHPDERALIEAAVSRAADAVEAIQREGLDRAMETFNRLA